MMTLTRKQIPSLLDALMNLDGDPKAPFKYSPKVRYSLAKNLRILTTKFQDIEKVRLGLIRELAPGTFEIQKGTPEAVAFSQKWEEFESGEEPCNTLRFTLSDLNLDTNQIPIAALAKLGPLLIEDDESPAKPA